MTRPSGTTKEIPVDNTPGWVWRLEIEQQFGSDPRLVFTLEKGFHTGDAAMIASFRDSDGKVAEEILDFNEGEPDELATDIVQRLLLRSFEAVPSTVVEGLSDHVYGWICEQRARAAAEAGSDPDI